MKVSYDDVLVWWRKQELYTPADYVQVLRNFRILFACNSSAIEGNSIDYHATREIFEDGKLNNFSGDLRDVMEMQNQKFAFEFVIKSLIKKKKIDIPFILKLHHLLLYGCYDERRWEKGERPGSFKKGDYCIGVDSEGSLPEDVETDLVALLEELEEFEGRDVMVLSSYFHLRFEQIHPFADGNGRVGRTLLNYYLMLSGYPPTILFSEDKEAYYMALAIYDKSARIDGFIAFLKEQTIKTWEGVVGDRSSTGLSDLLSF